MWSLATAYTFDSSDRVTKAEITVAGQVQTRTTTFNVNSDVTASVSANNFTGGANDTAATHTFDANNNPTKTTLPNGANVSATCAGTQTFQPDTVGDDRDATRFPSPRSTSTVP